MALLPSLWEFDGGFHHGNRSFLDELSSASPLSVRRSFLPRQGCHAQLLRTIPHLRPTDCAERQVPGTPGFGIRARCSRSYLSRPRIAITVDRWAPESSLAPARHSAMPRSIGIFRLLERLQDGSPEVGGSATLVPHIYPRFR